MDIKYDKVSIVIYIIFIVFLILALVVEKQDIHCRDMNGKTCGVGMGRTYARGIPADSDDIKTLLAKIRITSRYDLNSVIWRRCYIGAIISALVVVFVIKNRMATGLELVSSFLIIYITFYLIMTMFQKWIADPALKQMDDIVARLGHELSRAN